MISTKFYYSHLLIGIGLLAKTNGATYNSASKQSSCGWPPASQPLIVGGEPATPNEFPFVVNLRINSTRFVCGGTLIDLDLVLTAAHCLYNKFSGFGSGTESIKFLNVYAGDHILNQDDPNEQIINAESAVLHPEYSSFFTINDIALIKLSKPFTKTPYVSPISLPTSDRSNNNGKNATVAGWGAMQSGGSITNKLRKVYVPIVTGSVCNNEMSETSGSQLCAGGIGTDSCQGDSGSTLICSGAPDEICGIVSYGKGCGCPNIPGVYTNVFFFLDWINRRGQVAFTTTTTGNTQDSGSVRTEHDFRIILAITAVFINLWVFKDLQRFVFALLF